MSLYSNPFHVPSFHQDQNNDEANHQMYSNRSGGADNEIPVYYYQPAAPSASSYDSQVPIYVGGPPEPLQHQVYAYNVEGYLQPPANDYLINGNNSAADVYDDDRSNDAGDNGYRKELIGSYGLWGYSLSPSALPRSLWIAFILSFLLAIANYSVAYFVGPIVTVGWPILGVLLTFRLYLTQDNIEKAGGDLLSRHVTRGLALAVLASTIFAIVGQTTYATSTSHVYVHGIELSAIFYYVSAGCCFLWHLLWFCQALILSIRP